MKTKLSWLVCLLWASYTHGQEFSYEAQVAPVSTPGYYKITLSPELLGKLDPYRSDLRIYDGDGKELPYLRHSEKALSTTSLFKEYNILEKAYEQDTISYLIFGNPDRRAIDNVSIIVQNTDVQKRARLSGSEDQKNWYVIKDNYLLHAMQSTDATSELKILNFPLNDYAYFKLEINDNWKIPINILKVGYYDTHQIKGISTEFDYPIASQKDSLKTSYVKLDLSESKYFEKLSLEVSGAEYYSRSANIFVRKERLTSKKETEVYFESIGSIELNSNSRNEIQLRGRSVKTLYLEIDNKDNQPLDIEKAKASYLNRYVVAELQPEATYTLKFGEESLTTPDYDISSFAAKILPGASKIVHDDIVNLKPAEDAMDKEPSLFENPYLIWSAIGIVGLLLGLVSMKMIKEIGQKS